MKKISFILMFVVSGLFSFGQIYSTKTASIFFTSKAQMETNEANNLQVFSVLNTKTGDLVFKMLINAFEFKNKLMQKHFNENYLESDKFPDAKFSGKIKDLSVIKFDINGTYPVDVVGKLTIHGVTKDVTSKGTIEILTESIKGLSTFSISIKDYGIKVPEMVAQKVAEVVKITVDATWLPKK